MKEKLYNIPINDAVNAGDECPFCYIERKIEQDMMDFVLGSGSTYMESDVRDATDKAGFCREHYRKMFQYGNTLGNAWIMKTYLQHTIEDAEKSFGAIRLLRTVLRQLLARRAERIRLRITQSPNGLIREAEAVIYVTNSVTTMTDT